jgi:hypothetical protein
MRLLLVGPLLAIFVLGSLGQEVGTIDLSNIGVLPSDELAQGSMVEAYSCVGLSEAIPQEARTTLEWMETTDLYPRQRVRAEFRVENIGSTPLRLPIHATLADLQPKDPARPFVYYRMRLPLVAGIPSEGWSLNAGGLELYGSAKRPDTLLILKPGESIRVKGDVGVRRWYKLDQAITVSTDLELSKFEFRPQRTKTSSHPTPECHLGAWEPERPLNAYMHAERPTAIPPSKACRPTSDYCIDKAVH